MPETVRWLQGTYEETDPLGMDGRPRPAPFSFWRPQEPESIKRWCGTAVSWGSRSTMHQKRKTAAFIFRGSQSMGRLWRESFPAAETTGWQPFFQRPSERPWMRSWRIWTRRARLRPGFYCPRNMASFRGVQIFRRDPEIPRPLPIRISGLAAPWKSEPPVGRRLYRSAIRQSLLLSSA